MNNQFNQNYKRINNNHSDYFSYINNFNNNNPSYNFTDNTSTIAPGADVNFPQDGPSSSDSILRSSSNEFILTDPVHI